ncbi:hypothetical protein I3843_10G159300 [Carya illinoinensis]|uniref:Fe-S metabolism associated domain-containing protein n=1 Tax=Carya illinoinensis TaxID=32201 RepID=A0A8T1PE93_CARIL|nr:sufE-like protein 1, chloroplastic/mitochondrial [Carya illinoinensis]KAG2686256.1 hypothetical protein I3760_10G167500 [Carya illinoinensis]KAG6640368.1 hypothetical protein CIPAW_10G167200 [Carya illinoinensis]KAG6693370.1 hypothetical protein I3842_10G164600 [Carya illinoinensis]KAG7961072.1 hypothetical protein I3843_10G159300 [Carya illinoinensis]
MYSPSISPSVRLFSTKIIYPLLSYKTLTAPKPHTLSFSKTRSFHRLPTTLSSLASPLSSASGSVPLQPIEELPPKLQEIIKLFQSVEEPKAKYEQLLFYGKKLKPLETQFKTKENKVEGCVSQVWVRAFLDADKNVFYEADSDSILTKGLAALLVNGLSGRPVEEVLRVSPDFVVLLGLQQSLTPSRNNGFLNMLRLMQKKALQLVVETEKSKNLERRVHGGMGNMNSGLNPNVDVEENPEVILNSVSKINDSVGNVNFGLHSDVGVDENINSGDLGSRGKRIKEKLKRELSPVELEVEDISYQHAGHTGVKGSDGETHFNVKVVSKEFEGKSLVKRHRLVYALLQEELQSGLHALSIVAKAPSEV